jgi:hypothetical protein
MSDLVDLRFLLLVISAPGLGILGRAGFTLMAWVYNRPYSQPDTSDAFRLAVVSSDITLATIPLLVSFMVGLYASGAPVPAATIAVACALVIAYSLVYFFVARSRLAALRLSIRQRRTQQARP